VPKSPARVMRYHSEKSGAPAFGLVIEERDGVPRAVLNLTACVPEFGDQFSAFVKADGFSTAKSLWRECEDGLTDIELRSHLENVRPEHILPPVDVPIDAIRDHSRFVVSIGLNFRAHREETGRTRDLMMVKPVEPTGAYAPLTLGAEAQLVDHEAELGFALLSDIDLANVPSIDRLEERAAYFAVNDLTDRAPIILDEINGYTAGKSDAGFLPIGPWMIHGAALPIFSQPAPVAVSCRVAQRGAKAVERQRDTSDNLIRNPVEILRLLGEQLANDPTRAAADRQGGLHPYALRVGDRWILPAGSLVLTGTPGGTCIRPPSTLRRLGLLLRGGFSMVRARQRFIADCVAAKSRLGYLQSGDEVWTSVEHLGTQHWTVQ